MMRLTEFTSALAVMTIFTAVAAHAAPSLTTVETDKGAVLADENGMTLYTFRKDTPGVTNCYEQCAVNWPPLMAADGDMPEGAYSLVDRNDGGKQWAKDGMPLYYWINDKQKGDITGDGVGGVWDLVRP